MLKKYFKDKYYEQIHVRLQYRYKILVLIYHWFTKWTHFFKWKTSFLTKKITKIVMNTRGVTKGKSRPEVWIGDTIQILPWKQHGCWLKEMFALPRTHWECPKCTMLCPVKHMRCTMCLFRQPRQKSFTPEIVEGNQNCTPEIQKPAKKRKKKSQRHLFKKQQQRSTTKEKSVGVVLNTHERDRQRVNKAMETNKIPSKKRGEYSIQDMRRGAWSRELLCGKCGRKSAFLWILFAATSSNV